MTPDQNELDAFIFTPDDEENDDARDHESRIAAERAAAADMEARRSATSTGEPPESPVPSPSGPLPGAGGAAPGTGGPGA